MKNKILFAVICLALSVNLCNAQVNQNRFGFEFTGGGSLPLCRIDNASLKTGFGFEGLFHYNFFSRFGVYAGWGWNRFTPYSASDFCYEETGYVLGLNFTIMGKDPGISYFVRAGGLFNHVETEDANGFIITDTGHGPGFQVAGGVDMTLGNKWSFTPGIKFNSLTGEVVNEGLSKPIIYRYISARIGFTRKF